MKLISLGIIAALSLPLGTFAQTIIPNISYPAGSSPVVVFSSSADITTNNNTVTVASGATVIYQAGSSNKIDLKPGFHASAGSHFYAAIGGTVDTDGDGLPDVWERAHGLNPSNSSDASTGTSGGLTYLQEYQLGTTPTVSKETSTAPQLKINHPLP